MTTNVAIACQGGGSHTAYTAGVLETVLPHLAASEDCRLVGLSGTSGGAVSAVAAWYGYLDGGGDASADRVEELWADIAASSAYERWLNDWVVQGVRLENSPLPWPTLSPYHLPFSEMGKRQFLDTLERHVDFERLPALVEPDSPQLVVGTVDVNAGAFETFTDENVTAEAVLASSAVPTMFEAVELDGHHHWDGLFSQNPPVYELMHTDPDRKPDELWVVQINPQTRDEVPTSVSDIADRRNELAGNLSLNQELRFIETVNDWVDRGHLPAGEYSHTEIRRIALDQALDYATKMDRSEAFVEDLLAAGREDAAGFLDRVDPALHEHDARTDLEH